MPTYALLFPRRLIDCYFIKSSKQYFNNIQNKDKVKNNKSIRKKMALPLAWQMFWLPEAKMVLMDQTFLALQQEINYHSYQVLLIKRYQVVFKKHIIFWTRGAQLYPVLRVGHVFDSSHTTRGHPFQRVVPRNNKHPSSPPWFPQMR
jgi:hypothetical protein